MNDDIRLKLWVVKFCLKLIYPKFNSYSFLVFLAIKYRIYSRRRLLDTDIMDTFELKTIPAHIQRALLEDSLENNLDVNLHKIIIISREQYIQLCSQNLFYIDNGVVWLGIKLSPEFKKKCVNNASVKETMFKPNLHFVTSEIHKKLWTENSTNSLDIIRIAPVFGSKLVADNVALVNENEYHNILSSFGLNHCDNIAVTFHTVPTLENAPKIVPKAEVSLIVNEYDLENDFIKEVLNNYFEIPKLMTESDIFSIDLTPKITAKHHHKYIDLVESIGKLHFKCKRLGDESPNNSNVLQAYFIVKGVTQLTLGENIHALKPQDEYFQQEQCDSMSILKTCPLGLRHHFQQIQDTIQPFLTSAIEELSSVLSNPIIPMLLLTGSTGSGRHLLVKSLAKYNGMNYLQIDCNALQSTTAKQTESKISSTIQKAKAAAPVIVLLDNFEVFAVDPENNEDCRVMEYFMNIITDLYQNYTKHPIIFIAITEQVDLKPNILRIFLDKFHIPRPNAQQRYETLKWFASVMHLNINGEKPVQKLNLGSEDLLNKHSSDVLQRLAAKTETFLYGDLDTLMHFALRESYLKQHNVYNQLPPEPDLHLVQEEDFSCALDSMRKLQSQHLDAPKIPKVYWEDIGGLDKLKRELLKTIEFPIKYPHLFKNSSLKRSGILLYGPPGCGKTLVAKAVSTELNVSFLSVKGPELLNMYIGQSEENVRNVFASARSSSPCIVFLDELDALAPRRGAAGDSGGAADRVVSQLLAELDGVTTDPGVLVSSIIVSACILFLDELDSGGAADRVVSQLLAELDGVTTDPDSDTSFVFIMGATNRPDLLEQSLLRPGRLDKLIYVGPYVGLQEKTSVLKALCRNHKLRPEVNLEDVSLALPERCTGADLMQVVSTARSAAVRTLVHKLRAGQIKESDLSADSVIIGVSDMCEGVDSFRPSVTDEELAYYESLESQM